MKDKRKTELRVGLTVAAAVIIFLWILGWAKNFSLTASNKEIDVRFDNVSGLEIGDYVTVNGVKKGFVEDFKTAGEDVIVRVSIEEDVVLKKDAQFSISMLDLMGGKKIEIYPGVSGERLNINEVQNGVFNADIPSVMAMLGSVQGDLVSMIKDINVTLTSVNEYLTDEELAANVKGSMNELRVISGKLNAMIDENRTNFKVLAANSVELTEEAKNFIKDNKGDIAESVDNLNAVMKNADSLLTKLNSITDETRAGKNNLGKLMYDEEVYGKLNATLNQVTELTKVLLEQLKNEGINVDAHIDLF